MWVYLLWIAANATHSRNDRCFAYAQHDKEREHDKRKRHNVKGKSNKKG